MPVSCTAPMTVGTLCVKVEASRTVSVRSLEAQFGDGYLSRRPDGINTVMETWSVSTPLMSVDDAQALETELIALGANSFAWTPPYETTAKQWILQPYQWNWSYDADLASLSFTLQRFYN